MVQELINAGAALDLQTTMKGDAAMGLLGTAMHEESRPHLRCKGITK
jgi:hypothetical protein